MRTLVPCASCKRHIESHEVVGATVLADTAKK
jgi:hypothetical protein